MEVLIKSLDEPSRGTIMNTQGGPIPSGQSNPILIVKDYVRYYDE